MRSAPRAPAEARPRITLPTHAGDPVRHPQVSTRACGPTQPARQETDVAYRPKARVNRSPQPASVDQAEDPRRHRQQCPRVSTRPLRGLLNHRPHRRAGNSTTDPTAARATQPPTPRAPRATQPPTPPAPRATQPPSEGHALRFGPPVFRLVDSGSSHNGRRSVERMQRAWPTATLVQLPVHASWLIQVEIYFSILQRKAIATGDFTDLDDLAARILAFQQRSATTPPPALDWKYTRTDLNAYLARLHRHDTRNPSTPTRQPDPRRTNGDAH